MTWSPRPVRPDEMDEALDLLAVGFGLGPICPPHVRAAVEAVTEPDRLFVVEDEGRLVATGCALSMRVALPGGGSVPMAGVSEVVVAPTHRRRGILTAVLAQLHADAAAHGEPVAGLTASEGGIYRRFGYGVAARFQQVAVDAHRSGEIEPVGWDVTGPPSVRIVVGAEAEKVLPEVWDRHWRRVPGELHRTPGWWAEQALDPEQDREGASARFIALHHDRGGQPDGYVIYRIVQHFGMDGTNHEARIVDLAAPDDVVEAELLRFVLDVDLVGTVTWLAPVDLPLRWRLQDPRALTVTAERDHTWLRVLDVPACLAARSYAAAGDLTLHVVDDRGPAGGTFRLVTGPDGAACTPSDADPDLVVAVADLGTALAGGASWTTLARAGRVQVRTADTIDVADGLFRTARAAYSATAF